LVSLLETRIADEHVQILNEKIHDQEIKLREYEAKIAQLNEEKYKLNENLREMSGFCDEMKKEKDVIFENFQKAIENKDHIREKENIYDSFVSKNNEDNSQDVMSPKHILPEKLIKLSNWLTFFQNKMGNSINKDFEEISISSYS